MPATGGLAGQPGGTCPQAMKMAMSATSTEVVDLMHHCMPTGA
jgi:hypothetical protein